eukprot:3849038-Heterocapsa_arctica.AAC.1
MGEKTRESGATTENIEFGGNMFELRVLESMRRRVRAPLALECLTGAWAIGRSREVKRWSSSI